MDPGAYINIYWRVLLIFCKIQLSVVNSSWKEHFEVTADTISDSRLIQLKPVLGAVDSKIRKLKI